MLQVVSTYFFVVVVWKHLNNFIYEKTIKILSIFDGFSISPKYDGTYTPLEENCLYVEYIYEENRYTCEVYTTKQNN